MASRFVVVGYLVPSNTGRSYKVFIKGRFLGLIRTKDLANARSELMVKVPISTFNDFPQPKPTEQTTPKIADSEKLRNTCS